MFIVHGVMMQLLEACYQKYVQAAKDHVTRSSKGDSRSHIAVYLLLVYEENIDAADVRCVIADQIARLDRVMFKENV